MQRLKGRKNRHEEINIVDVNAADQIGNSAEMVAKYGTEEVAHQPSRVQIVVSNIIQHIVTLPKCGHGAVNIRRNFVCRGGEWQNIGHLARLFESRLTLIHDYKLIEIFISLV